MRRPTVALVVVTLIAPLAVGATVGTPATTDAPQPVSVRAELVAVHPNPVADGDDGEFVVARFPARTDLSAYVVADDEDRVRLPNRTVSGRVVLTADPGAVENHTAGPAGTNQPRSPWDHAGRNGTRGAVVEVAEIPRLANGGERVRLGRGNRTVSTLEYADAPEGQTWRPGGWTPRGATDLSVADAGPGEARLFVLPDAPGPPLAPVRNASDRVLLAGYTLTAERVARALVAAERRGADVRVLVEGAPVGGLARAQARRLDTLVGAGVAVRVLTGPLAPYRFHHAKYAVADGRGVVLTENWKPSGTGGRSSRGWGAVLADPEAVGALADTFRADFDGRGTVSWEAFREGRTFDAEDRAAGSYPEPVTPRRVQYDNASVLVAPDNAEGALVRRLDAAESSIRVLQVSIGGRQQPLLRATLGAARRGVDVRILLSSAWYVAEENRELVRWLNARAAREGLPLEASVASPGGRFEKVHAKGVVVDDAVALGSLNWNDNSLRRNREVLVVLEGAAAADYFASVFAADWSGGGGPRLPVGLPVALAVGAAACLLAARRLRFEG